VLLICNTAAGHGSRPGFNSSKTVSETVLGYQSPDAIPLSAIDHIEVLLDGAAAQYGSDAIAGAINVVLKAGVSRASVTSKFGLSNGSSPGASARRMV
jgi:outer membrane receptor protein involved in Fe transport